MLASCSPQPNWMPRNPKLMLNSCQNRKRGRSMGTVPFIAVGAESAACRRSAPRRSGGCRPPVSRDRKSTRLNSSHSQISYAVFCLKKKKPDQTDQNDIRHLGKNIHAQSAHLV